LRDLLIAAFGQESKLFKSKSHRLERDLEVPRERVEIDRSKPTCPTLVSESFLNADSRHQEFGRKALWKELLSLLERLALLEDVSRFWISKQVPTLVGEGPALLLDWMVRVDRNASADLVAP